MLNLSVAKLARLLLVIVTAISERFAQISVFLFIFISMQEYFIYNTLEKTETLVA